MKLYLSLPLFITILLISSCGQKLASTKATFGLSFQVADYQTGGIMVFGKNNSDGSYFGKVLTSTNSEVELENGNWDFISIGWTASSGVMKGISKCGNIENVELDGSDKVINFAMNSSECEDSDVFGPYPAFGTSFQINPLRVVACANMDAVHSTNVQTIDTTCYPSALKSIQVFIPELLQTGGTSADKGLKSACIEIPTRDTLTDLRVPLLKDPDGQVPLKVIIEGYTNSGCTGSKTVYDSKTTYAQNHKVQFANDQNFVFLHSNYCQGDKLTNSVLQNSSTTGSASYTICTRDQFIDAFKNYSNNKYILGQSIDFQGEDMIPHGLQVNGGGLNGLGHTLSNYTLNFSGANIDVGLFNSGYGNIENLKLNNVTANYDVNSSSLAGGSLLYGKISAASSLTDITVSNSIINLSSTSGSVTSFKTGLIVGQNSGFLNISNITIKNSKITLDGSAGSTINEIGLIGGNINAALKGISISDSKINVLPGSQILGVRDIGAVIGKGSGSGNILSDANIDGFSIFSDSSTITAQAIGGAIGFASEFTSIARVNTQFNFDFQYSASTHPDIGGVIGKVTHGGSPIHSFLKSNAIIKGNITNAGGIIGNDLSTGSNNYYLFANVDIEGSNTCGGLFGTANSLELKFSNSTGKVKCMGGSVGGLFGVSTYNSSVINFSSSSVELENSSSVGSGGLVGKYSASGTHIISHSLYNGILKLAGGDTTNGAFIGYCTGGCNIDNSVFSGDNTLYANKDFGTSTMVSIGVTNCEFKDTLGSVSLGRCNKHTNDATLISQLPTLIATDSLPSIWSTDGGIHLVSDRMNNLFPSSVGSSTKPFALDSTTKWNTIGLLLEKDSFFFTGMSAMLTSDIDFKNGSISFVQWPNFSGNFYGNDKVLKNITKDFGLNAAGIFKNISPNTNFSHEVAENKFKALYLSNIHFTSNASEASGIFASSIFNTSTAQSLFRGVYVSNSSLNSQGTGNAGVIGSISDTSSAGYTIISSFFVNNTSISTSTSSAAGVLIGDFIKSNTNTIYHGISNVVIDNLSSVSAANATYVGGIVGKSSSVKLNYVFSSAQIENASTVVGALIGQASATYITNSAATNNTITGSPTTSGALIGECATSSSLTNTYSTYRLNGAPLTLTAGSCINTASFSTSSQSGYDLTSTAISYNDLLNSEAYVSGILGTTQGSFYFDRGYHPRLRYEDTIMEKIVR